MPEKLQSGPHSYKLADSVAGPGVQGQLLCAEHGDILAVVVKGEKEEVLFSLSKERKDRRRRSSSPATKPIVVVSIGCI